MTPDTTFGGTGIEPRKKKKQLLLLLSITLVGLIGIPCNGLFLSLYNWVVFHPLYNPTNEGFFRGSIGLNRGHYLTNPNNALFCKGNPAKLPYICIV